MAKNITNKNIMDAINQIGPSVAEALAEQSDNNRNNTNGSSGAHGVFRRLGEVEQTQASHGAVLQTVVNNLRDVNAKLETVVNRLAQSRETKWSPLIATAAVVIAIVGGMGSLALNPFRVVDAEIKAEQTRIRDRIDMLMRSDAELRAARTYAEKHLDLLEARIHEHQGDGHPASIVNRFEGRTEDRIRKAEVMTMVNALNKRIDDIQRGGHGDRRGHKEETE